MPNRELVSWGLETGLSLTILIALVLIIRKPFARKFGARAAYALWALPALRLFMPAITLPILKPELPGITPTINYMGVDMLSLAANSAAQAAPTKTNFAMIAITLWISIAIGWLIWQLTWQHTYFRKLEANSRDICELKAGLCNSGIDQAMNKLGFKSAPHIRISNDNSGPLVTGLLRPMIILPANFETQFTPLQQHLALLHEMAHICRKDLWAAFAVILCRALFWPNPLIHYAARKFRNDQEAACDASVLRLTQSSVSVYAETLIQAARSTCHPRREAPLGLTIYHPLKERLMIMKSHNNRSSFMSRTAAGVLLLSVFAFTSPLTLAESADDSVLAGAPAAQPTSRRKIKLIQDVDGVKTEKQYEIETVNGVTKAWSIDEWGHKMQVALESIKGLNHMQSYEFPAEGQSKGPLRMTLREYNNSDGENRVIVKRAIRQGARFRIDKDGNRTELKEGEFMPFSEKDIETLINSSGAHMAFMDKDGQLSVKNFPDGKDIEIISMTSESFDSAKNGQNASVIFENSSEQNMGFDFEFTHDQHGPSQTQQAKAMMDAVSGLLDGVQTNELSSKAQRKIEKARKALQEAQEAINADK